ITYLSDIGCLEIQGASLSRRFCSLPELLPDTYLRDASLVTITPKRPIIVLRASGMFTMYAGI
ncbi:TPA: hypothetical protein ACNBNK_004574, partial [Escherichia coli]